MPRPPKCRMVESLPEVTYYKPRGIPMINLEEQVLPVEGFEALRLTEIEGLDQKNASKRMNVSRQTFGRILSAARKVLAETLVSGRALRIEGGSFLVEDRGREKRE